MHKIKKYIVISIIVQFLLINNIKAKGEDTTPLDFLLIGSGARAYSVAETLVAENSEIEAVAYNPAGAVRISDIEASFSHIKWLDTFQYEYISFLYPLGKGNNSSGNLMFNIKYYHMPSVSLLDSDGYNTGSSITAADLAVTAGYSKLLNKNLGIGINVKYINSKLYQYSASTFGADIGINYALSDILTLGLSARNLGLGIKYKDDSQAESMPSEVMAGSKFSIINSRKSSLKLNIYDDISYQFSGKMNAAVGAEAELYKYFIIGFGYKVLADTGNFNMGFGIKNLFKGFDFRVDYSFVPVSAINNLHVISLSAKFGKSKGTANAENSSVDVNDIEFDMAFTEGKRLYALSKYSDAIKEWKKIPKGNVNYEKAQKFIKVAENKIIALQGPDERAFKDGLKLYKEKDYAGAIASWEKIPSDSQYYDKAQKFIKVVKSKMGNSDKPGTVQKSDDELFKDGIKLYKEKDYAGAIASWEKIPSDSQYYDKAQKFIKVVKAKMGNSDNTVQKSDDELFKDGIKLYKEKDYAGAIASWEKIPSDSQYYDKAQEFIKVVKAKMNESKN